jgi:hypothetical protein
METDNNKMKNGEEVSGESTRMDGLFPADLSHVLRISRFGSEVSRRADLTFDERQQNLKKVLGNIRAFVPSEVSQRVHAVLYGKSDNAGGCHRVPRRCRTAAAGRAQTQIRSEHGHGGRHCISCRFRLPPAGRNGTPVQPDAGAVPSEIFHHQAAIPHHEQLSRL